MEKENTLCKKCGKSISSLPLMEVAALIKDGFELCTCHVEKLGVGAKGPGWTEGTIGKERRAQAGYLCLALWVGGTACIVTSAWIVMRWIL